MKRQKIEWTKALLRCLQSYIVLLCLAGFAQGQYLTFRFEKLGVDNGLSNQVVNCVLRDKTGYLWVGTENGLNRYDGYNFKHFLSDRKNKTALQDSNITTLFEDSKGNIWVGTKVGGLHLLDKRTETFYVFQNDPKNPNGLSDNRVYRMYEDKKGNLWIGTPGGLDKAVWAGNTPDTIRFTSFRYDPNNKESLSHNRVTAMVEDSSGRLWVGTKLGLNRMVSESPAKFERFLHDKNAPNSLPDDEIYSLLFDTDGNLWIGMWGVGLSKINASELSNAQPTFQRFNYDKETGRGLEHDIVLDMIEDTQGNLWLCNGNYGILTYLARGERSQPNPRFLTFANDEGNPFSFSGGSANSLFEDEQGLIWIAATTGGLNKLDISKSVFQIYRHHPGDVPGLSASSAGNVVEDVDGSIWVSSEGLTQIVPSKEPFSQPKYIYYKGGEGSTNGLRTNAVESLLLDSKGRLWVGTINGGLHLRKKEGDKISFQAFYKDPNNPKSLGNNAILTLLEDSKGTIWVGTYQGLYKMVEPSPENPETTFITYRSKKDDANSLSSDIVESLAEGADGNIWVGTTVGLNRLDPATGKVTRYAPDLENPNSLSHEYVGSLMTSSKGVLWIGTNGGLCKFDFATQTISRVSKETELSDLGISSLVEDAQGKIWVGTINGLFRFDAEKNISKHFSKNDGLPNVFFNRGAGYKAKSGTLYFGGTNGVTAFKPENIRANDFVPNVVLTELLLANHVQRIQSDSVLPAQIQFLDKITLKYTDNIFGIEFSALNFKQPEDNRYEYKLEGLSDDWIATDSKNRRATFTNLNPGEYTFRVRAANNDGVWNQKDVSIRILVLPPWWKTWWAQSLFYLLVILALLAVPFIRLSSLKKQRTLLETQVQERTSELSKANQQLLDANRAKSSFLSNMSHELRTPLNAVIGFAQLMGRDSKLTEEQHENLGIIERSGEHLLSLINDVLSISKIEAGRLSLSEEVFDPQKLLRSVEEMLRVRAESKHLLLGFEVAPNIPLAVRGDEGKLRQVLVNLLNNAIKFTDKGGVTLRCNWINSERARFEIEDTGVGIAEDDIPKLFEAFFQTDKGKQAKEGTGLGLAISKQIINLMGGDITVRSRQGVGTTFSFEVNLPATEEEFVQIERRKIVGLAANQSSSRILVVDDIFENRVLLTKLLSSVGFQVHEATNGQEAINEWSSWHPNLIFMDLRMPVMDGNTATQHIRTEEEKLTKDNVSSNGTEATNSHTKIIALTASAFEHERGAIIENGADDFIAKPFREETIFEKIAEHLCISYQYSDEDKSKETGDVQDSMDSSALTPERFAAIAPDTLAQLKHALRLGDDEAASRVADELKTTDPALAAAIQRAVKSFDFDAVLSAMGNG